MPISSTKSRWEYNGDGSTVNFTYSNKVFNSSELEVYVDNVLQTLDSDYTVSGAGEQTGGTVTFTTAPASGTSVVIIRVVPDTQQSDLPEGGPLPSSTVEDMVDRRTIVSQQTTEKLSRAILAPAGEALVSMELPAKAARASKHLGFDSSGAVVELDAPAGTTSVSSFGASLILAADAEAARNTLLAAEQGFLVAPSTPLAMTVTVAAGSLYDLVNRAIITKAAQTSGTITAPVTNPRFDIVHINRLTGVIGITTGAEAASPSDPTLAAGLLPLARISLATSTTEITSDEITDIRELANIGAGSAATVNTGSAAGEVETNDQVFVDVASATTTNIGAAASRNVRITGTTTITAFDTVNEGIRRKVRFAAALTLTHNGTSLILPGSADITTAANDTAEFISLGSGNWLCLSYKKADGRSVIEPTAAQGSSFVLLASADASSDASIDFDGVFSSTYKHYILYCENVKGSAENGMFCRTDSAGGASYDSGTTDYIWSIDGWDANAGSSKGADSGTGAGANRQQINLSNGSVGNAAGEGANFEIHIHDPANSSFRTVISWSGGFADPTAGEEVVVNGIAHRAAAQAVDSIQFVVAGANVDTGEFRLYGLKAS